jgi:hypothetical protein
MRVYNKQPHQLLPGEYGRWDADDGNWYAVPPNTDLTANLSAHRVEEHDDGTITVEPSILVSDHKSSWHGYLKHGQWEQCP